MHLIKRSPMTNNRIANRPITNKPGNTLLAAFSLLLGSLLLSAGCTPTVKVATDEPITINLNVNIKHEIRVKVEKDLDAVLSEDSGLF